MLKKKLLSMASALLFVAILLPIILVNAFAFDGYDYSKVGSSHNQLVGPSDFLEIYTGAPLSEAERDYLTKYSGFSIAYDNGITTSNIVTSVIDGILSVYAYEYEYVAANGIKVCWIPTSAAFGSNETLMVKTPDHYECFFDGASSDISEHITVNYLLTILVDKDDVNEIINLAFDKAPAISEEIENNKRAYESARDKHEKDLLAYENYLIAVSEYKVALALYNEYLSKKHVYDEALAEYNAYLSDLAAYEKAVEDYAAYEIALKEYNTAYAAYREYLIVMQQYNEKYDVYKEYCDTMMLIKNQLDALNHTITPMTSMNRDVYYAITGTLVTSVLENKDLITSELVNADAAVVDSAGIATENLRTLLKHYFSLATDVDRYAYYTVNYEAIRDNFVLLLQCLDNLYSNRRIRAEIIRQEKQQKYLILVAQLAIIANALTDGPVYSYNGNYIFDSKYKIEEKTIAQLLEYNIIIVDTENASPVPGGFPQKVEEPTLPQHMDEPKRPEAVQVPAKPQPVADPGNAPDAVENPTIPIEVNDPGPAPEEYVPEPELVALVEAYSDGLLSKRTPAESDYELNLVESVRKKVFNVTTSTVVFCDPNGEILHITSVDTGTRADFVGVIPTKQEDASATYLFDGWVDSDGEKVDLSSVNEDLNLYPSFKAITKYYDVTFDVDGVKTIVNLPYGSIPEYDSIPIREDDERFEYTFRSWDKPLAAVEGECTYSAIFDSTYILPFLGSGGAVITEDESNFYADCSLSSSPVFNIQGIIERAIGGDKLKGLVLNSRFCNLTVSYSVLLAMSEAGDCILEPKIIQNGIHGYSYLLEVKNALGDVSRNAYRVSFFAPCAIADTANMRLSYVDESSERVYSNFSISEGLINFTLNSLYKYSLITEYTVNLIPSQLVDITLSMDHARPDDVVYVSIDVPAGVALDKVYMVDSEGNEITVENGRFRMPSSDVTVGVISSFIEYKVTFMNGYTVIATYVCRYGDVVTPPSDPSKLADGLYSYTFVGWSSEILPVTEDAVYTAVYKADLLPPKEPPKGIQISPGILRLLIAGGVGVSMFVLVVVPSLIMSIIVVRRAKKAYLKPKKK